MHPSDLKPGACYFMVQYYDRESLVPAIMTLRYEQAGTAEDGTSLWIFREEGEKIGEDGVRVISHQRIPESLLGLVLDFDELMALLNELRVVSGQDSPVSEFLTLAEVLQKYSLKERISEFLESPTYKKWKCRIRYRAGVLFLKKNAAEVALTLFLAPLRMPDANERFDRLMAERGIRPFDDGIGNRGRTRFLEFRLVAQAQPIAELCGALLAVVYQVEPSDEIVISAE